MPPNLMGVTEIAEYLRVSKQRVIQLAQTEAFPAPVTELAAGRIWEAADIEVWARKTGRAK